MEFEDEVGTWQPEHFSRLLGTYRKELRDVVVYTDESALYVKISILHRRFGKMLE